MKVFKSIMLYLLIAIGVAAAAVLICCVLLMMSPKTSIFGYKYVSYKDTHTRELIQSQYTSDIDAISITTNRMAINIVPHTGVDHIKIVYKQGMSGFVKKDTVLELVEPTVEERQFVGVNDENSYKTIVIKVNEPEGLVFLKDSKMTVYVPVDISYSVIHAQTGKGELTYVEAANSLQKIHVDNLYLSASTADINISAVNVKNYNVTTTTGDLLINNNNEDINANIAFNTKTGSFATSSTINGSFTVNSTVGSVGPNIKVKKILGSFTYTSPSGNVSVESIGDEKTSKGANLIINSTNAKFSIGSVYGFTSVQPYNARENVSLTFDINYLYNIYNAEKQSFIESGAGNITIGTLKGYAHFKTSTGNVTVKDAWESMQIKSTNGTINVKYNIGAPVNNDLGGFQVFTEESYVTATNLHSVVYIEVTGDKFSRSRKLDLAFTEVVGASTINAFSHDVSITTKVGQIYTLLTKNTTAVEILTSAGSWSSYAITDSDYKAAFAGYNAYRVGYNVGAGSSVAKSITVTTTSSIHVQGMA